MIIRFTNPSRQATLFAALTLTLLTGCQVGGGGGNPTTNTSGNSTASGNFLRYPLNAEPTTLDPATVEDGTTIDLIQNVYEGLVKWNENNKVVPNLAEKWDVSPDGKTYIFSIKQGVKFHDGTDLTADDFKYAIERACDPNTRSATASDYLNDVVGAVEKRNGDAKEVSGVKVLEPYKLQVTIDAPKSYWIAKLTYPISFAVSKEAIEKNGGKLDEKSAVGTGPFKVTGYQRGYEVKLEAFKEYHGGAPKVDGITRPIVLDGNTRLNKYQNDELDYCPISPRDLETVNNDTTLKGELQTFPRAEIWYLALNQAAPGSPFKDMKVRQAFAHALDKDSIIRIALKGQVDKADGIVPPSVPGANKSIQPYSFDPAKAKDLLAQAGFPGGKGFPALSLTFRKDQPEVGDTASVMAQQLKENLGINVELKPMEWGQFLEDRKKKTMTLFHLRWAADYLDPQNFLSVMLHTSRVVNGVESHPNNGVGYSNPEFDKLCDAADVERDEAKRFGMYQKAEQIAVSEAPWVPIYFRKELELIKPRVGGLRNSLFGHLPHTTTTLK